MSPSNKNQPSQSKKPPILFLLGALRFGFHGIGGIVCVALTLAAFHHHQAILLHWISQVVNGILATHATTLLSQVPARTAIIPGWIVAPHKEAFKRTIGMMQYLVVRIVCSKLLGLSPVAAFAAVTVPYLLSLVPNRNTFRRGSLDNGNTWIFVLPIWVGTTADMMVLFWYGDQLISLQQLLQVELVGLGLAFGFTLAFRNYLPMPFVYAMAAWQVWGILREGYLTIKGD